MRKILILLALWLLSHNAFSQNGFKIGLDFGKSVSLNSLLHKKQTLQNETHLYRFYPQNYSKELILRFPNIINVGALLEYHFNNKEFVRLKFSNSTNWLMISGRSPTNFDLIFPGAYYHYTQNISFYALNYNRQKTKKNHSFIYGMGGHIASYKQDITKKREYNHLTGSSEMRFYNEGNDSNVIITRTRLNVDDKPFAALVGLNLNLEYSFRFKKAGRLSLYANAFINLTKSNLLFIVTHNVYKYDRQNQQFVHKFPEELHTFRFSNNPLQFGIIYYLPSFELNREISHK